MLGRFYTNCALVTRRIEGRDELLSESSQVVQLETEDDFSIVSPMSFVTGAEVTVRPTQGSQDEEVTGTIISLDGRTADIATRRDDGYVITRYPVERLSVLSPVNKTQIVMDGTITERMGEFCWQGKGFLDIDRGKLSFHVRLINATTRPFTFSKIIISDTSYGGNSSRAVYAMTRTTETQSPLPGGDNRFKTESYDLGGPHTIETMKSMKVWEQDVVSVKGLYYDLIQGTNHIFTHCNYEGEIYSGDYTVTINSLNVRQNVYINPSREKRIEVQLTNQHAPYSIDVIRMERNENGFLYQLTIKNNSNTPIPLNIFVYKQSNYGYEPSAKDTGTNIIWIVNLAPRESKTVFLMAKRIGDTTKVPTSVLPSPEQ